MFFVTKGVSFKPCVSKSKSFSRHITPNLEVFQILWYYICPDFGPFNYIPPMFSMAPHRTRARPLIVAPIHLFGGESKSAKAP